MTPELSTLIGGLLGTAAMTVFLLLPRWMNWGHVDVIRAAGALVTRGHGNAFQVGFVVHLISGIAFAYIYLGIFSLMNLPLNVLTGLLAGAIHGVIVMLLVSITIMEHHPVAKYRHRGPMTGFMQLFAHAIYGIVVGATVQILTSFA